MKTLMLVLLSLCAISELSAQEPFPHDEALKQLYRDYDAGKKTAQWVRTKEQGRDGMHEGGGAQKGVQRFRSRSCL